MSVKIINFGGPLIWQLRIRYSSILSKYMLEFVAALYKRNINKYIKKFMESDPIPLPRNVMIETINRCNGKCSFCPANIYDEKRDFSVMENSTFYKILQDLKDLNWTGKFYLNINNEPFMDKRIVQFAKDVKRTLNSGDVSVCVITNGTLINISTLEQIKDCVDSLIINDYGDKYSFTPHIQELYKYLKGNKEYNEMDIRINRRYAKEILATRAGNAPNKSKKNNKVSSPCIYPYTDLAINPKGIAIMCCNDCFEDTNFGDVNHENLYDIWNNEKFRTLRSAMQNGRECYPFCAECDVVDAGTREQSISKDSDTPEFFV